MLQCTSLELFPGYTLFSIFTQFRMGSPHVTFMSLPVVMLPANLSCALVPPQPCLGVSQVEVSFRIGPMEQSQVTLLNQAPFPCWWSLFQCSDHFVQRHQGGLKLSLSTFSYIPPTIWRTSVSLQVHRGADSVKHRILHFLLASQMLRPFSTYKIYLVSQTQVWNCFAMTVCYRLVISMWLKKMLLLDFVPLSSLWKCRS